MKMLGRCWRALAGTVRLYRRLLRLDAVEQGRMERLDPFKLAPEAPKVYHKMRTMRGLSRACVS